MCGTKTCEKCRFLMRKGTKIALNPRATLWLFCEVFSLQPIGINRVLKRDFTSLIIQYIILDKDCLWTVYWGCWRDLIAMHLSQIVLDLFETLSKILCKWKQDSAVSLFLYLNSVFKNKHKLIHNQAPVMNRLCPFLLNLHKWKIHSLFDCIIRREWKLWFRVLSDFSVQVFNKICSIDYFSDFQRKLEENSQIIPQLFLCWKRSIPTQSERFNPPTIIAKMGLKRA